MTTLNSRDLELAKKHGFPAQGIIDGRCVDHFLFTHDELAAYNAERDAEQQPNAEAVGYVADMAAEGCPPMHCFRFNVAAETLPLGTKLFTHQLHPTVSKVLAWAEEGREHNVISNLVKQTNKNDWVKSYTIPLSTHAPSQGITRERLSDILKDVHEAADAILAERNHAQPK